MNLTANLKYVWASHVQLTRLIDSTNVWLAYALTCLVELDIENYFKAVGRAVAIHICTVALTIQADICGCVRRHLKDHINLSGNSLFMQVIRIVITVRYDDLFKIVKVDRLGQR